MSKKQNKENLQEELTTQNEEVDSKNSVEEQDSDNSETKIEENVVEEVNVDKLQGDYNKAVVALELAQKDLEQQKDQYLRLRAEFENYRRRTSQESVLQRAKGIEAGVEAFFPCLDALDRAISISTDEANLQGLNLIKKQFDQALKKLGVTEINPENEEFDPEFHNAVMHEVDPDNAGKVLQVLQKGYKYNDMLLRPAMVKVATDE